MATATLELSAMRRQLYTSSSAVSMADSLPVLNFGFDELRTRMSAFTQRFDDFIEQGRKRVLEERNQFRMSVAQVQESQATSHRALTTLRSKSASHAQTLSLQTSEKTEMQDTIASLTSIRDAHATAIAAVRARLQTTRAAVAAKKATQKKQAEHMRGQARADEGEVGFWEEALGMRVEGVGVPDRVRFVFVFEKGRRGEAWFELDMPDAGGRQGGSVGAGAAAGGNGGVRGYEIVASEPKVEAERAEWCLKKMNEGVEDLPGFLKAMREVMRQAFD